MKLLAFDHPELDGRYEWLADDRDVDDAMRALAKQAYRRNRRELPAERLGELLRDHGTVDAEPYVPRAA